MDNAGPGNRLYNQWDNLPELEAVRVFAAVAEAKSFRRAAAALRLPRSTVSRRLSILETALKARLLQRTTRHVSLTDAGEAFLKRVGPALHAIRDAGRGVLDATAEPRGVLRVTATSASATSVGAILLQLVERYPQVHLDLEFSDRKVDLVAEGFDLAVRPGPLEDSSLVARPLGHGQPGYYASPAYLKRRRRPKTPRELEDHACLVFSGSSRVARWRFQVGRRTREVAVRGPLRANSLEVVRQAAVRGHGVAWLPETLARKDLEAGRLLPVLRDYWPSPVPVHLVYPSSRYLAPQVRVAIDALTSGLGEGLP